MALRDLVLDPDTFFEERKYGRMRYASVVVILTVLAAITEVFAVAARFGDRVGEVEQALVMMIAIVSVPRIVWWFGLALGFYVMTRLFTPSIFKERLIRYTAWGFFPLIIGELVLTGARYLSLGNVDPPAAITTGFPWTEFEAVEEFLADGASEPVFLLGVGIYVLFVLWSSYLWMYGIKHSAEVELRQAAIAVVPPVLVYLYWIVSSLTPLL